MATYRLQAAYLPQGWARDVLVTVSEGMIVSIETSEPGEPQPAESQPAKPQPARADIESVEDRKSVV